MTTQRTFTLFSNYPVYFLVGLSLGVLVLLSLLIDNAILRIIGAVWPIDRLFSILTGFLLLSGILWQWRLFWFRNSVDKNLKMRELNYHKWIGSLFLVLLLVHAAGFGFRLKSLLAACVIVIVFTGLFHSHVLATRSRELSRAWEWVHLGISAFLMPLVMIHAWAAFAFKSF
jgi:hypothetical protein